MKISELHKLFLESSSVITDTRKIEEGAMFFALKGENFNGNYFAKSALDLGANYAIIDDESYFLNSNTILVEDVLTTLQKLASYHRKYLNIPIIALTGSNGKTTTKELINAVLSKKFKTTATIGNLNNHIGVPLTILSMSKNTEIGIVEMGANHQKEIEFLCDIVFPDFGYITNFGKAHLDGFGGVEGVIKGKTEMYNHIITNNKFLFVNISDSIQMEKSQNTNRLTFGPENLKSDVGVNFKNANPYVVCEFDEITVESHLIGEYNFNNISAAIAIGKYFNVDVNSIKDAIENYIPSNNRSQILDLNTNEIILDAYNANPSSMQAAIENFSKQNGRKLAILGDMFELGVDSKVEHEFIAKLINESNVDQVFLIGNHFYNTEIKSNKIEKYIDFEDFKFEIKNLKSIKDHLILIKGSRGMKLERVLELF